MSADFGINCKSPKNKNNTSLPLPTQDGSRLFGIVSRSLGGKQFRVECRDKETRVCILRSPTKRWCFVSSLVLVEPNDTGASGDIMHVYNYTDAQLLHTLGALPPGTSIDPISDVDVRYRCHEDYLHLRLALTAMLDALNSENDRAWMQQASTALIYGDKISSRQMVADLNCCANHAIELYARDNWKHNLQQELNNASHNSSWGK